MSLFSAFNVLGFARESTFTEAYSCKICFIMKYSECDPCQEVYIFTCSPSNGKNYVVELFHGWQLVKVGSGGFD